MRGSTLRRAAAAAAALLTLLGVTAGASSAAAPSPSTDRLEVSVAKGRALADELECPVPPVQTNVWLRTRSCQTVSATVNVLRDETWVGRAEFTIQNVMTLDTERTQWTERIRVSKARLTGDAKDLRVQLRASCNTFCKATVKMGAFTLGNSAKSGRIVYSVPVKKYEIRRNMAHYSFDITRPGFSVGLVAYDSALFRCDDRFSNKVRQFHKDPGCVFPQRPVTEENQRLLPYISQNIHNVQSQGVHLGSPNYGRPLHRLQKPRQQSANRNAVCGNQTPPPGLPFPEPQCDEYPYASTYEGGTTQAPPNRATMWVPAQENRRQGSYLSRFYREFRVLDGDPYYVAVGV
ncbi:NucA/NucB deoxyribonuclease domain-containing protein [Streptomyces sp. BPTC-684]|uniref:NucA/NucB deoxyribonuclease domain-containing protein n=1 Tax=Streptomyces sp. BPTC-684 TaxID=3043734 RepID=UPI0024B07779|nr:NucA/NucB deoxyribonuclease domain-containing protein [Streptomyces sp. BPTC-684]WHM40949.1 NucA/NucB deoxyribonuclease domain-containing protein [Streptomyces sp. BPTC-684]